MEERKTGRIRRKIVEIVLLFAVFFLPGYLSQPEIPDAALFNSLRFNLLNIISGLPQILLLLYIMTDCESAASALPRLERFGIRPFRAADLARSLLVFAGIFGILGLAGIINSLLFRGTPSIWTNRVDWRLDSPSVLPIVVVTLLLTGYREELFFRSYLLTRIEEMGLPGWAGALVGSVLFALGHIYQGFAAFAGAFLIGLFLSFVFLRTRNFHPLAIGHGLYNAAAIILVTLFPRITGTG